MAEYRPYNLTRLGWGVALPVLFLTTVGLFAIHATDRTIAAQGESIGMAPDMQTEMGWGEHVVETVGPRTLRQGLYFAGGLALLLATLWPSYQKIGRYSFAIYGVVVFLLLLLVIDRYGVDLPMIPVRRNTRRWIDFAGLFSIQPSEFMKPALILALARYLRYRDSYRRLLGLIAPFLLTMVPMVLILKQPDLGTLLMLLPVLFAMLFVAGARLRHLLLVIVVGAATMPLFYYFGMHDYQRQRIQVVFKQGTDDERWHMNQGYQLRQSKIALGTGGVWGEGFGHGMFVEHALLPEEQNDFIFAII
ncbi:MAG: FtsW/RodA/SpoVE family cell cycle protein, partial [Phycisphaerae bacterium]|nr:FtsW/RodA/SpoVE family cell cycle protein [Phycisphaerae bacterium]